VEAIKAGAIEKMLSSVGAAANRLSANNSGNPLFIFPIAKIAYTARVFKVSRYVLLLHLTE
jgi:hypothetical protein